MSDVVQGAIIGGVAALAGGIVSGVVAFAINRQQNKLNLDQLKMKFEFDEKQARLERLINGRSYLSDIKKLLGDLEISYFEAQLAQKEIIKEYNNKGMTSDRQNARLTNILGKILTQSEELTKFMGQTSDEQLIELLEKKEVEYRQSMTVIRDTGLFFKGVENKGKPFPASLTLSEGVKLKVLRQIGQRIEHLLCGDE